MLARIKSRLVGMSEELRQFEWAQLFQLSQAGKWPLSVRLVLNLLCLLLVALVAEFLWLQVLRSKIEQQALAMVAIEQQTGAEKLQLFDIAAGSGNWQDALIMQLLLLHASAETEPAGMLDVLHDNATSHGLGVLLLTPGSVYQQGDVYVYDMTLQATGDVKGIGDFLQTLTFLPIHIGLANLVIETSGGLADAAQFKADFLVAINADGVFGTPPVPAQSSQTKGFLGVPQVLDKNLRPVGFLQKAGQHAELWRDGSGRLYRRVSQTW